MIWRDLDPRQCEKRECVAQDIPLQRNLRISTPENGLFAEQKFVR